MAVRLPAPTYRRAPTRGSGQPVAVEPPQHRLEILRHVDHAAARKQEQRAVARSRRRRSRRSPATAWVCPPTSRRTTNRPTRVPASSWPPGGAGHGPHSASTTGCDAVTSSTIRSPVMLRFARQLDRHGLHSLAVASQQCEDVGVGLPENPAGPGRPAPDRPAASRGVPWSPACRARAGRRTREGPGR